VAEAVSRASRKDWFFGIDALRLVVGLAIS